MGEEIDDIEELVTGAGDIADLEASLDDDLDDLGPATPPMDIPKTQSMGEQIAPTEAVERLNESFEGKELLGMWGSASEQNIQIAQQAGAEIIADMERHDPSAAAALLDSVRGLTEAQEVALIAALAKRGRQR